MTERWQDCSANVFVIASVMCFYNPDVRTAGEPRLAACPEKPEMPHQPNQQGNVSYTTPHSIPLIDNTLCTGTLGLYSFCIHRDEVHQLDDMINANIWDSSVDHQFHNYEHVSCHSSRGISQFSLQIHSFFSVNVKGCIHLAVSIPKVSGFLAILTHKLLPKLRDPFLAPATQLKVGIRQKVRNVQW